MNYVWQAAFILAIRNVRSLHLVSEPQFKKLLNNRFILW